MVEGGFGVNFAILVLFFEAWSSGVGESRSGGGI
jgi:hypothetical protein